MHLSKFLLLVIILYQSNLYAKTDANNRKFTFIYEVELKSSNGAKLELWLPIPKTNNIQIISNLKLDTQDLFYEYKSEKSYGNTYVYIYSYNGTHSKKNIKLTFDVLRYEQQNIHDITTNIHKYLRSSNMIPVGGAFSTIIEKNNLNNNNVRGIYDFVLKGMHYGKPKSIDDKYYKEPWLDGESRYGNKEVSRDDVVEFYEIANKTDSKYTFGNGNSTYACDIGVGNCTDYHSYFLSLSRTLNIPGRFHMGFLIPNGKEGPVGGYHCWADYYENKSWYPVDISEADKDTTMIDYFFGRACFNRVEMMIGRDFEFDNYEKNPVNIFIYPLLEIDDHSSNSFKKNFSYKEIIK